MRLVEAELKTREGKRWMLDGFPRTQAQAKLVDESFRIDFVINVDVPFDEVRMRDRHADWQIKKLCI